MNIVLIAMVIFLYSSVTNNSLIRLINLTFKNKEFPPNIVDKVINLESLFEILKELSNV